MHCLRILVLPTIVATTFFACTHQPKSQHLMPDHPLEKESPGARVHLYHFETMEGHYEEIEVDQLGLDVMVSIYGPTGEKPTLPTRRKWENWEQVSRLSPPQLITRFLPACERCHQLAAFYAHLRDFPILTLSCYEEAASCKELEG